MKPGPVPKNNVRDFPSGDNLKPQFCEPDCPSHLSDAAKLEWERIVKFLAKYKMVTDIDTAALALYCASYGRWQEAEAQIKKNKLEGGDGLIIKSPKGYPINNPYLSIANRAMEDCHKYLQQFGLSPVARTRVQQGMQGDLFPDAPSKKYFT